MSKLWNKLVWVWKWFWGPTYEIILYDSSGKEVVRLMGEPREPSESVRTRALKIYRNHTGLGGERDMT